MRSDITKPRAKKTTFKNPGANLVQTPAQVVIGTLAILLLTLIAYSPAFRAGFIWDDDVLLTANALIKAPDGLVSFWLTRKPVDYWPLTMSSLWLEWRMWGMNASGYHVTNVLLHATSALLIWRVLTNLKIRGGWWAGLLFALHPVNVQSVAWISERKNTLSLVFYLLTILFYLRSERGVGLTKWYWLSLASFALALFSKTSGVLLPIFLLGCSWWQREQITRKDVQRTMPFLLCSAVMALTTIWFQYNRSIGRVVLHDVDFWSRLAGAGWALWFYLYKSVMPFNLTFVYPNGR